MDKPNDKLILAESKFGMKPFVKRPFPEFTIEDLTDMGITFTSTDQTKMIEIPFYAQKKLIECFKSWGFGATAALDEMLRKILKMGGLDGKVQTKCNEQTFSFIAWQTNEP